MWAESNFKWGPQATNKNWILQYYYVMGLGNLIILLHVPISTVEVNLVLMFCLAHRKVGSYFP